MTDERIAAAKRRLDWAKENYNNAYMEGAVSATCYWDGYIRAMEHTLEERDE